MTTLDHLILRVNDASASVRFYTQVLGLTHEGCSPPFEVLRVHDGLNLDLREEAPKDAMHLAFRLGRQDFENSKRWLVQNGIEFGGEPFSRDGQVGRQQGARGWQPAVYFYDPDGHNIEIRLDETD
jgi:catechol 2,3-dioxygenase-like lactoylglutathione lyase family enzyme